MPGDWMNDLPENKHDTVNEFIRRKKAMGRSQSTLYEYSRILKRFYHEHFPSVAPEETEVRHIEDYLYILEERGVSDNGKRRYIESLSAFFSYAMKRPRFEGITGNPAAVVLEELPRRIKDRPDCATWENGAKIIHQIGDPRNKTVAIILAKTGARLSEALEIKMDDLNLDDGFIRLRERKGGKQTVVPIDQETSRAIQRYTHLRNSRGLDYLFVSTRGQRLSKEQIRRSVRNAAVEADVMDEDEKRFHKKFTPHTYRTVFTTLMRNQGMSDHILQYIRGDANSDTMDIYTRVDRSQARQEYLNCIKKLHL